MVGANTDDYFLVEHEASLENGTGIFGYLIYCKGVDLLLQFEYHKRGIYRRRTALELPNVIINEISGVRDSARCSMTV